MTHQEDNSICRELELLLIQSLDGAITNDEFSRLESILKYDIRARNCYRSFLYLYCDMEMMHKVREANVSCEHAGSVASKNVNSDFGELDSELWSALQDVEQSAPILDIPKQEEEKTKRIDKVVYPKNQNSLSNKNLFTVILSAAALIFLILYPHYALIVESSRVDVGTVVHQKDAVWTDQANSYQKGDRLYSSKPLCLISGIVDIQTNDGVKLIVEGPSEFKFTTEGDLWLDKGKLYADVPLQGIGFSVKTAHAKIIDLGTEFGVLADNNRNSEVHVIKGKVQLFAGSKGHPRTGQLITENSAVRYDAISNQVRSIPIKRESFISAIDSVILRVWPGVHMETFNNLTLEGWGTQTYIGDNEIVWNVNAKGTSGYINRSKCVYMVAGLIGIQSNPIPCGIQSFSASCKNLWFPEIERKLELLVNGDVVGSIRHLGTEVYTFTVENINIPGNVTIGIRNATTDGIDNRSIAIDNITWTSLNADPNQPLSLGPDWTIETDGTNDHSRIKPYEMCL